MVCGATQGIGLAAAQHLAGLGARVTLLARNAERLEEARRSLSQPERHGTAQADFSRPEEVKAAIESVVNAQPVHILVNNTGGPAGGPIVDAEVEAFMNTFQQHLVCNHLLAQAVLPGMKAAGYGRIINVISTSVKQPLNNLGVSNTIRVRWPIGPKPGPTKWACMGSPSTTCCPAPQTQPDWNKSFRTKRAKLEPQPQKFGHKWPMQCP